MRRKTCHYVQFVPLPSTFANSVQIVEMCAALEACGLETTLFATRADGFEGSAEDVRLAYGIDRPLRIRWVDETRPGFRTRMRTISAVRAAAGQCDLVYTRNPTVAVSATLLRKPCVYEMHMPDVPRLERAFMRRVLTSASTRTVAISQRLADLIQATYGVDGCRIMVEHDGYDPSAYEGLTPSSVDPDTGGRLVAAYVGSFYRGRGIETVLELARRCEEWVFLVVGGTAAEAGFEGGGAPKNVVFRARVPHGDVPALLRSADVLLMPYSRRVAVGGGGDTAEYCSPLKMFEYLGSGRPIVSARLPSIAEVLTDDENALLVEPDDLDGWESSLTRLARDESTRARLASEGLKTAALHTWDGRARRILAGIV
jgi:glycosyltransferase involved in cell wall biosynthesis